MLAVLLASASVSSARDPRPPTRVRRPVIALPPLDPESAVTWPLVRPPAMQPHLPLLVGEYPSCVARAPTFEARYASAWCLIRRNHDDRARAADELFTLAGESHGEIRVAVVRDLAEVLADTTTPTLASDRAARLPELADTLVATYVENGDRDAAAIVARTIATPSVGPGQTPRDCRGVVRDTNLGLPLASAECLEERLREECRTLLLRNEAGDDRTSFVDVRMACDAELAHEPPDAAAIQMRVLYASWGWERSDGKWLAFADEAMRLMPMPGADQLAVAALENAGDVRYCRPPAVIRLAHALEAKVTAAELHTRLAALETPVQGC